MKTYILKHDTPEILRGAIVKYVASRDRYIVTNLEDVARYPLKRSGSYFTFHADIVEKEGYWFEQCVQCCENFDF